jgi:large subunit ribosomal protein L31
MKKDIHPEYLPTTITCTCGTVIETRSTRQNTHVEICSSCHPLYTGKQKIVDSEGRVEKFQRRFGKNKK